MLGKEPNSTDDVEAQAYRPMSGVYENRLLIVDCSRQTASLQQLYKVANLRR